MAERNLLILERSTAVLSTTKSQDGSVILEGVFTQFGVRNKNNRIYEEQEVMPHIKELQEKVKTKKLLGELDHPKDFDISLSNVSHVIEDLSYDAANKQVKGRIRLLNTSKGKEAKALIEDGIPLHISSRAAGTVGDDGRVKIKKWFTYDLVADPGFENAELSRVNESFGFDSDENLFIYEINKPINKVQETKETNMDHTYVTSEDFNKYTEYLKTEIKSLKEARESAGSGKTDQLVKYAESIAEKVNGITEYVNYLAESFDKGITYSNYLAENMNSIKNYAGYIAEQLDGSIRYSEHVAEKADQGIQFSNYLAEKTEQSIKFSNYLAEKTEQSIKFSNYLGESLNKSIGYSEYVGEKTEHAIMYAEYLKEGLEKGLAYSDYIAEQVNGEYSKLLAEKNGTSVTTVATQTAKAASYKSSLNESISALINKAETKTNSNMAFMNFLTENKKREFTALSAEMQGKIVGAMNERNVMSTVDTNRIWDSCFMVEERRSNFIDDMPAKYHDKWNGLSEGRKKQLLAEATFYPLTNAYQINNFWSTRDLREKQVQLEKINESISPAAPEVQNQYAVSAEQRADIVSRMKFNLGR
jgi:hypothetical protein